MRTSILTLIAVGLMLALQPNSSEARSLRIKGDGFSQLSRSNRLKRTRRSVQVRGFRRRARSARFRQPSYLSYPGYPLWANRALTDSQNR